jgi:hypothetical protein
MRSNRKKKKQVVGTSPFGGFQPSAGNVQPATNVFGSPKTNTTNQQQTEQENTNVWTTEKVDELLRLVDDEGLDFKQISNPFFDGNPEYKAPNVIWEYSPQELDEVKKCAQSAVYFAKYCQVMTDDGLNYIRLRDYQVSVLNQYQKNRFNVFLAPRQVGKSITSSIILVWYLLFNHDKNAMILANVGDTAIELMDKIKAIVRGLPFFLKPGMIVNNVMKMQFDNGCRAIAKTTTKTSAIGFTIHFLYMDEFAHIHPNFIESFFRSTYPTVSSSKVSRIIITSTPNGMNKFYEIYQSALEGENTFYPIRVDWWQVPGRDEKWKQNEIANLGSEELFNQEYGNQFLSSSSLLLDSTDLKRIKNNSAEYIWKEIGPLHDRDFNYENLSWHPKFDVDSIIESGGKFVFSVDIAAGNSGDFTVVNMFKVVPLPKQVIQEMDENDFQDESDFFGLLQVGILRDNQMKLEDLKKFLEVMCLEVFGSDNIKLLVEMNFKGELLFEKLTSNEDFYEEIFVFTKQSENARQLKPGIRYTNDKVKLKYCENLRTYVKKNRVMLNDQKYTIPEMFTFGMNNKGSYSGMGSHDDVAMTVVNLGAIFDSEEFSQLAGELYDDLRLEDYKSMIESKLQDDNAPQADPWGRPSYNTKQGGDFKSFNDLI